ncbi:TetR/AcrR family transcriptional regulator [Paenirhodobacter sp.]|uniref:TetR/AcrR family transcriptional regulator n=1 Tax=Paenirhodobacter sp. TaxID=1965326 RepID=UPI003B3FFF67
MKNNTPRPRGRPRAFDRDEALAKAAETFWRLGYEGASIADLTAAMGITPQSLYAAFSSKADLYREALAWYQVHIGAWAVEALADPDVGAALTRLLRDAAREFTRPDHPHGCMVSTAVLTCAVENAPVARHVSGLREATIGIIRARIERGIAEGQFRPDTDAGALARFVGAMIQGMSVQAQDGASEGALAALAEHAIAEIARRRMENPDRLPHPAKGFI